MKINILKYIVIILTIISVLMCQSNKVKVIDDNEKSKLSGVWGLSINENASFWIKGDSIYYPEHFKSFKYTTSKDSIYILFDGWTYKGTFRFRNDSLILKSQNKEDVFVRIRK